MVGSPCVQSTSLTATGRPASGPSGLPALRRRSIASACASAAAASTRRNACTCAVVPLDRSRQRPGQLDRGRPRRTRIASKHLDGGLFQQRRHGSNPAGFRTRKLWPCEVNQQPVRVPLLPQCARRGHRTALLAEHARHASQHLPQAVAPTRSLHVAQHGRHAVALFVALGGVGQGGFAAAGSAHDVGAEDVGQRPWRGPSARPARCRPAATGPCSWRIRPSCVVIVSNSAGDNRSRASSETFSTSSRNQGHGETVESSQ